MALQYLFLGAVRRGPLEFYTNVFGSTNWDYNVSAGQRSVYGFAKALRT
jgi:hypothetical protein